MKKEIKDFDKIPQEIEENIDVENHWTGTFYYSTLSFENQRFVENIYALKITSKLVQRQLIAKVFETENYKAANKAIGKNCYYNYSGCASGFHCFFAQKHYSYYYGTFYFTNELKTITFDQKIRRTELFTIEDAIKLDPTIKYCAYEENEYIKFIDYIKLYRTFPIAEMCMKLELYRLCDPKALEKLTEDKAFARWVFKNKDDLKDICFRHALSSYKKSQNPLDYVRSLQYRIDCGREISLQTKGILKFTNQEKIYEYLKKNNIRPSSYNDYILACEWLMLDFSDTKVLFPHNFQEMHDLYTEQYFRMKAEKEIKAEEEKYASISKKMEETALKYAYCNYNNENYSIIVAKSKQELIYEGAVLEHCVGRMNYDEKQADGVSLICFLRKNEKLDYPFVTIELKIPSFEIRQCYGKNDSIVEGIEEIKNEWLENIKKERRKLNNDNV